VAIITGSTSGIGAATARVFVREGASVVVSGRNGQRGRTIVADLGEQAFFVRADVTSESDIANLVEAALARVGRIDCLFNNAAASTRDIPVTDIDAKLRSLKAPKSIDLLAELPRSSNGKVLQAEPRKRYWDGQDRNIG